MANWIRQPQETTGDYWFSGQGYLTRGVDTEIPKVEIIQILDDLRRFVQQEQGIDYLQVYVNESTGRKVWVIDQLTRLQIRSGEFSPGDNHFTILFPEEY